MDFQIYLELVHFLVTYLKYFLYCVNVVMAIFLMMKIKETLREQNEDNNSNNNNHNGNNNQNDNYCKKILLVTAHPDDEAMFFIPSIISLIKDGLTVYLLCLSSGDYDGKGRIRKEELYKSCNILNIPSTNIEIVEHDELPDDPNREWDPQIISSIICKFLSKHKIRKILTFDDKGVSGHKNHISVYKAVKLLIDTQNGISNILHQHNNNNNDINENNNHREDNHQFIGFKQSDEEDIVIEEIEDDNNNENNDNNIDLEENDNKKIQSSYCMIQNQTIKAYQLHTTNIIRKYLSILDFPISLFSDFIYFSPNFIIFSFKAMNAHHSQFVWYRKLFVLFSRYTFINTLSEIK
eukprot:TRINITY_DN5682_c0_g2_i1.p1 TRINITY_DN5682_c0_g2~~TRINITY_DN5682_c0_g2_i1.p1  ORF type:complete len:351 (+),score=67.97 TRINITY_DN5682_c0_g2_i1:76-1128(+)